MLSAAMLFEVQMRRWFHSADQRLEIRFHTKNPFMFKPVFEAQTTRKPGPQASTRWSAARGGSRYVDGVLGISLLENGKVTKFAFHVFGRYEIHIQDFEDCPQGYSSFSGARLRLFNFSNFQKIECFKNS